MSVDRQDRVCLLDVSSLAERLGVTERFVRRLVHERRIPFLKIGHYVRFDPADIDELISHARVERVDHSAVRQPALLSSRRAAR